MVIRESSLSFFLSRSSVSDKAERDIKVTIPPCYNHDAFILQWLILKKQSCWIKNDTFLLLMCGWAEEYCHLWWNTWEKGPQYSLNRVVWAVGTFFLCFRKLKFMLPCSLFKDGEYDSVYFTIQCNTRSAKRVDNCCKSWRYKFIFKNINIKVIANYKLM